MLMETHTEEDQRVTCGSVTVCSLPRKKRSILSRKRRRTMNDFHDEVLVEILLRLPLTSGFQCKSVSKRRLSLISTSYFA